MKQHHLDQSDMQFTPESPTLEGHLLGLHLGLCHCDICQVPSRRGSPSSEPSIFTPQSRLDLRTRSGSDPVGWVRRIARPVNAGDLAERRGSLEVFENGELLW